MNFWYDDANIYHMYTFGVCNTPFINDYNIKEYKLDEIEKWIAHLKEMNFNTVYFGPLFKSKTHGYDTTDYFEIDNRIGDNKSFKDLVSKLHENNIKVVLDAVLNHCGRDFFAFQDVIKNKGQSKYCDWFLGIDFNKNNHYNDGFDYDTWSGYYELVKYNLKNKEIKTHLLDAVKFWVEYFEIDGLRLDAANVLDLNFLRELRIMTDSLKKDFWLMGETVHGDYNTIANDEMLHSVTNYEIYKGLYSSHNDKNLFEIAYSLNRQKDVYKNKKFYNFVDNHDQDRLASVVDNPAYLYTIYTLLYTIPGIPSVYYGSEWGIKGIRKNGSDKGVRPYININNDYYKDFDLERVIKKLSKIRNENEVLRNGDYKEILVTYELLFAFERNLNNEKIIVIINSSDKDAEANINQFNKSYYDLLNDEKVEGQNILVNSHWGRILKEC